MSNIKQLEPQKKSHPKLIECLKHLLADNYGLLLKTQNYHWNVTGPQFHSLHVMFEEQYTDLFAAVDLIAERIRALGDLAPGSYSEFSQLSKLKEGNNQFKDTDMIKDLIESHDHLIHDLSVAIKTSQEEKDAVSEGILINRQEIHEKTRWMLHATLEK